jgi:transcriptional regulator with XRE-family HTH domain
MDRKPPTLLKMAIVAAGVKQRDLAQRLDINEPTFSRIVNGGLHADDATRAAIAHALDVPEHDLWPTAHTEAA